MREVGLLDDLFVGSANAQADIDSVAFLLDRLLVERAAHDPETCQDCVEKGVPEPDPCAGCGRDVDDPGSIYCAACIVLDCEEDPAFDPEDEDPE